MKTTLNQTNLSVTPICLGTVNFGSSLPHADSIRQLDEYTDIGGNFIDTAHIYGDWNPGDGPLSEAVIGKWLNQRGKRSSVVISTKGAHPNVATMHVPRFSNAEIQEDLDDSLRTLNTDYIDLYFLHRDDVSRPVEEIIEFLELNVKAGKIRYYGCSNWKLERIKEANAYAKSRGFQGFSCNQLMWSLADITFDGLMDKSFVLMDDYTYDYHAQIGLNVMAYSSIAKGYFPRRHNNETLAKDITDVYENDVNENIYSVLQDACVENPSAITDYPIRYLIDSHPFPSVAIVSFDNIQQLKENMGSLEADINEEIMQRIISFKNQ